MATIIKPENVAHVLVGGKWYPVVPGSFLIFQGGWEGCETETWFSFDIKPDLPPVSEDETLAELFVRETRNTDGDQFMMGPITSIQAFSENPAPMP